MNELMFPEQGFIDRALRLGHKLYAPTNLFGKNYAWLTDDEGTFYLVLVDAP